MRKLLLIAALLHPLALSLVIYGQDAQPPVPGSSGVAPPQASDQLTAPESAPLHVWPRVFQSDAGDSMTIYQPQVDSWAQFDKMRFRAALSVTPAGSGQTE